MFSQGLAEEQPLLAKKQRTPLAIPKVTVVDEGMVPLTSECVLL